MILALVYDVFRAHRSVREISDLHIFFQDIFYSLFSAFTTFIFLLCVTNGEIRGFALLGIFGGFLLSRYTVSVLWFKILRTVLGCFFKCERAVVGTFYRTFDAFEKNIGIFLKKSGKSLKKLLKKPYGLLYIKRVKKLRRINS